MYQVTLSFVSVDREADCYTLHVLVDESGAIQNRSYFNKYYGNSLRVKNGHLKALVLKRFAIAVPLQEGHLQQLCLEGVGLLTCEVQLQQRVPVCQICCNTDWDELLASV